MGSSEDRYEIVFFDVETTVPTRPGIGFAILEFGSILVCPRKLVELESYSTLVRPADLSHISTLSVRCNGITRDAVIAAPTFRDVADRVYDILHGRIWAGHNILKFDCARIREAFADIGRPAPEPKGTIDSLALLTQRFGRRAGNMKMATLATYFGLGQQTHRSLDDVRMNLEVLKYCATVLFLESSLPDVLTTNSGVSPNAITRSRSINGKSSPEGPSLSVNAPSASLNNGNSQVVSSTNQITIENHPILSLMAPSREEVPSLVGSNTSRPDPFNMAPLSGEIVIESDLPDDNMEEKSIPVSPDLLSTAAVYQCNNSSVEFLEPDDVSIPSISASLAQLYPGSQKIKLLHKDNTLQLQCACLKVRFGISTKFVDRAGRPRLNFVVNASPSLCRVLDSCDGIAQKLSLESGSSSEWRPVVTRKTGVVNYPTVRLHIPTAACGEIAIYATEIYQKENSGCVQRLVFSKFDASELNSLFTPGTFVDAFFSLDTYDYQQNAGIRLVAKKLIIHSD
ncbi:Exonuclease/helicase-like [Parasponia andersonii]|uniref:Exonuclease/helicase-like n=1 Tax=Parasponia andersonii TaxID=3476 RepID=A0A2P5D6L0_PARAD|nr:Exonuclease/helicase-like [Parasponia andersonii]